MRDLLQKFDKETLISFLCQGMWLRNTAELERDLLFIAWEQQQERAQKMTSEAIEALKVAKTAKQRLQAEVDWEKAQAAHKKADRLWGKLEALRPA